MSDSISSAEAGSIRYEGEPLRSSDSLRGEGSAPIVPFANADGVRGEDYDFDSEPLRICVLAACPFPANHGTPGSIREMVEGLAERGHDVHLVTYPHGEDLPVRGVHIHRVSGLFGEDRVTVGPTSRKPVYDFLMVLKAIRVCRKHRIQVMHAHLYEAAIAAWLTRIFTRVPYVYSAHNTMGDELSSYGFFRWKWFANTLARFLDWFVPARANVCLPHSHNIEQFLHGRGLQDRCAPIINFGIDIADVDQRRDQADVQRFADLPRPLIAYTGILDHFQRIDVLLDAMKQVVVQHPQAHLAIGMTLDQPEFVAELRSQVDDAGLADNVTFTPRLSFDDCLSLLETADIAVSPRPQTPGFPIKLLNYFAMEKPVVMFASSSSGLEHKQHAWLAENDTPDSLAKGLIALADDAALCRTLAAGGREFLVNEHDRRAVVEKLERVFRGLVPADAVRREESSAEEKNAGESLPTVSDSTVSELGAQTEPGASEPTTVAVDS